MNDKKSAHLEQAHMTPLKRAFAVPSEKLRIPTTRTTARIYPRRTVASRPTTPAPVVHNITTTLTSANSQPHNSTSHMHATQLAAVQRETPSHTDGMPPTLSISQALALSSYLHFLSALSEKLLQRRAIDGLTHFSDLPSHLERTLL